MPVSSTAFATTSPVSPPLEGIWDPGLDAFFGNASSEGSVASHDAVDGSEPYELRSVITYLRDQSGTRGPYGTFQHESHEGSTLHWAQQLAAYLSGSYSSSAGNGTQSSSESSSRNCLSVVCEPELDGTFVLITVIFLVSTVGVITGLLSYFQSNHSLNQ